MRDAAGCRILLNRLEREIDRLRLGLDEYCNIQTSAPIDVEADRCEDRQAIRIDQSQDRPLYAAAPVGRIEPDDSPEYESRPIFLNRYPIVTNLGTIVDALL